MVRKYEKKSSSKRLSISPYVTLNLASVYEKRGRPRCRYFLRFTTMNARIGPEAQFHFLESTQKS